MKLLMLPISTRRTLIYCEPPGAVTVGEKQTYLDKGVNYASKTWADWEKSNTTWKLKITEYGNRMLRRIPFEEWGLKSIPTLQKARRAEMEAILSEQNTPGRQNDRTAKDKLKSLYVDVRFPGLYQGVSKKSVTDILRQLSTERQALHKKRMTWSVVAMPFTIPFALIPVVPNLPFLYLVYRAFSHWRALNGSRHLEFLVSNNLLTPSPSKTLDSMYTRGLLHASRDDSRSASDPTDSQSKQVIDLIKRQLDGTSPSSSTSSTSSTSSSSPPSTPNIGDSSTGTSPPLLTTSGPTKLGLDTPKQDQSQATEIMLLRSWNGKLMAEELSLPGLEVEIERAVEQVERELNKQKEKREEKTGTQKMKDDPKETVMEKAGPGS